MLGPAVVVLCGPSGSGKTRALKALNAESPGRVQLLAPPGPGERPNGWLPDFTNFGAVALDGLTAWPRETVNQFVLGLEQAAEIADKKLILVVRALSELSETGVQLAAEPLVCEVLGPQSMRVTFRRRSLVLDEASQA
jgi:energy-coupling factor transporter ATP-binding protein EcfA2